MMSGLELNNKALGAYLENEDCWLGDNLTGVRGKKHFESLHIYPQFFKYKSS